MALYQWFLRCAPGLSILLLFLLIELSLGVGRSTYLYLHHKQPQRPLLDPIVPQLLFSAYSLFLHVLAFVFPLRLANAARTATNGIRSYHARDVLPLKQNEPSTIMVIILPAYKETLDTMRETLDVLASHTDASTSYDVSIGRVINTILTVPGLPSHGGARSQRDSKCEADDRRVCCPVSGLASNLPPSGHPRGERRKKLKRELDRSGGHGQIQRRE